MKVAEFHEKERIKALAKEREAENQERGGNAAFQKKAKGNTAKVPISEEKIAEKSINCFKNFISVAKMDNENEEQETIEPNVNAIMELL